MIFSLRCRNPRDGRIKWEWVWSEGGPIYIIQPANGWWTVDAMYRFLPTIRLAVRRGDLLEFKELPL